MTLLYKKGFSLPETIVYLTLLVAISSVLVRTVVSTTSGYRALKVTKNIETAGGQAMERMVRQIRNAQGISTASSTFNTSPGVLVLNTFDSLGYATTVQFSLQNGALRVKEGVKDLGPLYATGTSATSLIFRQISTGKSSGVKIELSLRSTLASTTRTEKFYSTVIARGSY